jgi:organic hydroperoxide reductase OsmC/OhrA
MAVRSRTFTYAASVGADGTIRADGAGPVTVPAGWSPDHMVLAAVVRCSLGSLRHHAARAGMTVEGEGEAHGTVARREDDGRFALVAVDVHLSVRLDPAPSPEALRELLGKAERDCFVGASLRARPVYRWTVDGADVEREPSEVAA